MNKLVFKHATIKSPAKIAAAQAHNRRETVCPNADPEKTPYNKVLIGEEKANYVKTMNERYSGIVIVKNAVLAHDIVIGVGRLAPVTNPFFSVFGFCSICADWAKNCIGEGNIIDMVCHRDEHAPHIHLITTNLTTRGALSATGFLRERGGLSAMQTDLAKRLAPLGLERGLEGSYVHNMPIKSAFYADVNRAKGLVLPPPQRGQSIEDYARTVIDAFAQRKAESIKEEKLIGSKMNAALEELDRLGCGTPEEYWELLKGYFDRMKDVRYNKEDYERFTAIQRADNYGLLKEESLLTPEEIENYGYDVHERYDYDDFVL